mgnify:CR=1 FL=1
MTKFIIKRLLISAVLLFFITFLIYLIMRFMPGSYVETVARELSKLPGSRPYQEWLALLNKQYGLDRDVFSGFIFWFKDAIRGDFGDSWYFTVPVIDKFKEVIWNSFFLSAITMVLQLVIAIPLGVTAARKQYSVTDYVITVVALIGISLPTFFIATLLQYGFALKLDWLPLSGMIDPRSTASPGSFAYILDVGYHYILPIVTLVIVNIGGLMRYTRTNMLEVMNSDYIRTARAKGLSEKRVINYHAFRNTLIPIVTVVGGMLPSLFGGAMFTETIFELKGIGFTSYQALINGDIPFTMFYLTFMAILTLVGTLIADILYAVVDPRVRIN